MLITAFPRNQTFDPEATAIMAAAFDDACITLGLADGADGLTNIIAARIIDLAQRGVRTRAELYQGAIKGFKPHGVERRPAARLPAAGLCEFGSSRPKHRIGK